jgi:anti-sigma factor RsiW
VNEEKPTRESIHLPADCKYSSHACEEIESLALLYACDELEAAERAALEAHATTCPACAAVLARELRLHAVIVSLDQPADSLDRSGLLLARCRSELAEALDDQQAKANRSFWRAAFSPVAWWSELRDTVVYHPAVGMGMAVLVVAAFLAGHLEQRWRVAPPTASGPAQPTLTAAVAPVPNPPKVTDKQLRSAESAHVTWMTPSDSSTPTVQVELMSQTPMNIIGTPDDQDVERALTYFLENSQRFDPDTRLDSLDVLRTRAADPGVRRTLCAAAREDGDPGVRMKALEALQGFEQDPVVHETLLDALQTDDSSGVRVEAINLLVASLQSPNGSSEPDPQTLDVLRDRLRNDPNHYVRVQSAAALRQLGQQ